MNESHWYDRLHLRANIIFFVVLVVLTGVGWFVFADYPREQLHLIRKGVATGMVAAIGSGLIVALYTRLLVRRRLKRAKRRVQIALRGDEYEPHMEQDEVDLMSNEIVDGIGSLREHIGRLEQETARLSVLLSGMSEAVVMTDERERILIANPVAEERLELPPSYVGRRLADVCGVAEVADIVSNVLWHAEREIREVEYATAPNDTRHASVSAAPIVDDDSVAIGAVVVLYDVTRLRRLEKVRRDFVANVSHELRTPIATIQSFSETLMMDSMQLSPDAQDFAETIHRHATRMGTMVEDLLTLSKLEAAGEDFTRRGVNLPSIVADIVDRYETVAKSSGVELLVDVEDDMPLIDGEPRAIAQVLQNLVENGVKYTPDGGTVCISARVNEGRAFVDVSDSGIGIPPEHIHRVFERFYRVDEGRSREVGGTGLGLAIVKHLVRQLGGDITVESTIGAGTRFSFWLPIRAIDITDTESE